MPARAVILSGSLGLGHDVVSEVLSGTLASLGWQARTLDCMSLLGPRAGRAGGWVFRRLMAMPGVFDGLHFAHLRTGSPLASAMDRAATPRLVAALRGRLRDEPADLVISVFAAGVPAVAELAASRPSLRTVVREGAEFITFLRRRDSSASWAPARLLGPDPGRSLQVAARLGRPVAGRPRAGLPAIWAPVLPGVLRGSLGFG